MVAKGKEKQSEDKTRLQLASPASSADKVPLTKDENETAAILEQQATRRSLFQASLDRELQAISEKMSQPCYHERLRRTVTFADAMLRDLFDIRHVSGEEEKFRLELKSGLLNILCRLRKKDYISADFVEKTHIELILGRVRVAKWGFSIISRLIAEALYQRFERQRWGRRVAQPVTPADQDKKNKGKRKRDASPPRAQAGKQQRNKGSVDGIHIKKPIPKEDNPIFGTSGPMRGTLIKYNTADPRKVVKSIVLNPEADQISSKVYGHNGITMGQVYLRQMAALAQGAHGSSQSGISGTAEEGAYSIIATGTYKAVEKDGLERFEYCAAGSLDNTFRDSLIESQGLKTLRTSLATGRPVRVLRGPNDEFRYAPRFGLRYDGLYIVVEERRSHNAKGGLYAVFVLERVKDQDPVDLNRPNAEDFEQLTQLKKMLE